MRTECPEAFVSSLGIQGIRPIEGPHRLPDGSVGVTVSMSDGIVATAMVRQSPGANLTSNNDGTMTFSWQEMPSFGARGPTGASMLDDGRLWVVGGVLAAAVAGWATLQVAPDPYADDRWSDG